MCKATLDFVEHQQPTSLASLLQCRPAQRLQPPRPLFHDTRPPFQRLSDVCSSRVSAAPAPDLKWSWGDCVVDRTLKSSYKPSTNLLSVQVVLIQ